MPTVEGTVQWLAFGLLGGLIAEAIRLAEGLHKGVQPKPLELLGSLIYVALGAGAWFYGVESTPAFEVATLGAAFPLLFAAAVRALKPKSDPDLDDTNESQWNRLVRYMASDW